MQNSVLLVLPEGNNRGVEAEGEEEGTEVWLECLVFPSNGFQLCALAFATATTTATEAASGTERGTVTCGSRLGGGEGPLELRRNSLTETDASNADAAAAAATADEDAS